MENRFNLIDEPWIPVADHGRVSLKQIFSNPDYRSLGGNPIQKIALLKLLLAIAQSAATPKDEADWKTLGSEGLAQRCLAYLDKWHDRFYLYGEKPFLQMPNICKAKQYSLGSAVPEVSTGNTTVLSQVQVERQLDNADKALLITTISGFSLGGKKADNSIVLSRGYGGKFNSKGNASTPKPGPSLGDKGFLHSFIFLGNVVESIWINLLTHMQVKKIGIYPEGVGVAPWEKMPDGEDCAQAKILKASLIGRLVPLSRFCWLSNEGFHNTEGIIHSGYADGVFDPTMAVNFTGNSPQVLLADPDKRPWRELTALLGFLETKENQGFRCECLYYGVDRAVDITGGFSLWSGGLKVFKHSTGEQYVSTGDFVESTIWLESKALGEPWIEQLKREMAELESLSKILWSKVFSYFKELRTDNGKKKANTYAGKVASQAKHLFWQLCERDFQNLVDHCDQTEESAIARQKLRHRFADYSQQAYDKYCPRATARQLDAWAKCRPNHSQYLKQEV